MPRAACCFLEAEDWLPWMRAGSRGKGNGNGSNDCLRRGVQLIQSELRFSFEVIT